VAWGLACGTWLAAAEPFELISARDLSQTPPVGGSGDSWAPIISPDGRYVLFASLANNLVVTSNGTALPVSAALHLNVFLRDRTNGATTLVSVNPTGVCGGNGDSVPTALSTNGRYALFESRASDLAAGATNGLTEVFIRDLASDLTFLVSVSTNRGSAIGVCRGSTMTPDGRYVAFVSSAANLVPGDTNGIPDVFVRDLQLGVTTLASTGAQATNAYSLTGSESPDLTPDGRYVAFYTTASNLVPGVATGGEIYIHDLVAGTNLWVSGAARALLGTSNAVSFNHVLSAGGDYVAYETCALPTPSWASGQGLILRFSPVTGLTDIVFTNAFVATGPAEDIRTIDMTPDGRFIVFVASLSGTVGASCILLWDAQSGLTTLVSGDLDGNAPTNAICDTPMIDPTGRFVAFLSSATNLVTNSLVGDYHLYVRDVQAGTTTLVDAGTNGAGSLINPSTAPRLTADGNWLAFECLDASLVPNDRNHDYDVFMHDVAAGTTEMISVHAAPFASASANGPSAISSICVSTNGRWVAFTSEADNLGTNNTLGFRQVFVRDRLTGSNVLASVGTNGLAADGICSEPAISGNGCCVAFSSAADNLAVGNAEHTRNVFLRDLQAGTTTLVSVNANGTGPGNDLSESPQTSTDGRFILFLSKASNLASGSFAPGMENLFLRDMHAGATYALSSNGVISASMTPDGLLVAFAITNNSLAGRILLFASRLGLVVETNFVGVAVGPLAISADGTKIVCFGSNAVPGLYLVDRLTRTNGSIVPGLYPVGSRFGLRFSTDQRFLTYAASTLPLNYSSDNQVYLYDFQTHRNVLLSHAFDSILAANGPSDSPDISADGRFVAYRSYATNLFPAYTSNSTPNLILYDGMSGTSSLLTADRTSGAPGDNRSLLPVFSAAGRTLLFQSWASDLIPDDFNHWDDVLALSLLYVTITPGGGPGQGATLTWPVRPGENYLVQFKTSLGDAAWQPVSGNVTVSGNQANLTDLAPSSGQRFYRVVAF